MSEWVRRVRARLFADVPRDRDAYHAEIEGRLAPGMDVLDVGCGKGVLHPFTWERFPQIRVVGIDPDPEAASNPRIRDFCLLLPGEPWTLPAESFDLAICRYVLEHIADPSEFLTNVRRILKPGGQLIFLTPSKYYPVMIVSAALPHGSHRRILARTKGSAESDVFATFYRMNSKRALRRQARQHGFEVELLMQRDFQPADYLDFNALLFVSNLIAYYVGKFLRLDHQIGASLLGVFRRR